MIPLFLHSKYETLTKDFVKEIDPTAHLPQSGLYIIMAYFLFDYWGIEL